MRLILLCLDLGLVKLWCGLKSGVVSTLPARIADKNCSGSVEGGEGEGVEGKGKDVAIGVED
jgi:hypothetical protein